MAKCYDCKAPATHGVRCLLHVTRHRAKCLRAYRDRSPMEWITPYCCRTCGKTGHNSKTCAKRAA